MSVHFFKVHRRQCLRRQQPLLSSSLLSSSSSSSTSMAASCQSGGPWADFPPPLRCLNCPPPYAASALSSRSQSAQQRQLEENDARGRIGRLWKSKAAAFSWRPERRAWQEGRLLENMQQYAFSWGSRCRSGRAWQQEPPFLRGRSRSHRNGEIGQGVRNIRSVHWPFAFQTLHILQTGSGRRSRHAAGTIRRWIFHHDALDSPVSSSDPS
jgi:hypothetical protein